MLHPVKDAGFGARVRGFCESRKIQTLEELSQWREADLLSLKNFGDTSLKEVRRALRAGGLRLGSPRDRDELPMSLPMSLRDWFAGQALIGLMAGARGEFVDTAAVAYAYADDMLVARKEPSAQ